MQVRVRLNPDNADVYYNKGIALGYLERYDEAIKCFDVAFEINPSYTSTWYGKSAFLVKKGDINEALKNLEEAIRLDKTYIDYAKTD